MSESDWSVEPRWKEEIVYREGGRRFVFEGGWGMTPMKLYVPHADDWDRVLPAWMRGRRAEILDRLATAAGHVLEVEPSGASLYRPHD
ncbi:hypothetical protein [Microbacterium sp. JZ31]|uniref:hypothetical protein n=1 Tax=Microbacterium sp. JZ31 TaxID=1906274 RepID=UPI001EE43D63|nr:hypothetical protein [Microbacterium sp. JZ31]